MLPDTQDEWMDVSQTEYDINQWIPMPPTYVPEVIETVPTKTKVIREFIYSHPNSFIILRCSERGILRLDKRRDDITYQVMLKTCLKDELNIAFMNKN